MSEFDINKVKKLTREDLEDKRPKPLTLDGLKQMCNFFDEDNPVTYEVFLRYRPDLTEAEVAYYRDIIDTLKENEKLKLEILHERGLRSYQKFIKDTE